MKYNEKIDSIIETAFEQKKISKDQREKILFAKSIFTDLLNKTDKLSLQDIKQKGSAGKIGWTEVTDEMLSGLLALRETLEANPELRKSRRRRSRNAADILKNHQAEMDRLYQAVLQDTPVRIQTSDGTVDGKVEMRIIYTEGNKQRIRTLPAAFSSVKIAK
ncbi:MAG: hypothetical protein ACOCVC_00475 [Spirochaeta sp.]